jgi:transposase
MGKHPRSYPPDFREKIVALARTGRRLDDLADEFGLARQTVRNWVKQADVDSGVRSDGLTSEERAELSRLRRENKRLTVENEILSKAAAWFARETNSIPDKHSNS